jgi:hypothetical protein
MEEKMSMPSLFDALEAETDQVHEMVQEESAA